MSAPNPIRSRRQTRPEGSPAAATQAVAFWAFGVIAYLGLFNDELGDRRLGVGEVLDDPWRHPHQLYA